MALVIRLAFRLKSWKLPLISTKVCHAEQENHSLNAGPLELPVRCSIEVSLTNRYGIGNKTIPYINCVPTIHIPMIPIRDQWFHYLCSVKRDPEAVHFLSGLH
jgi:hypothetical protein